MLLRYAVLVALVAGCAGAPEVGGLSQAVGEQQDGFPNPWERALFMAANRARSDPATVKGPQSTIYPPQAPLVEAHDLARSARFHATTLAKGMAPLMHESPCTLRSDVGTSGCDGSPDCACVGGATCNSCDDCPAGTNPFVRIKYFYAAGGAGEVAAAGYGDPWGVMDGWVDEAAGQDGHRQIVDDGGLGVAGFGHSDSPPGACWRTFDVGDFGAAKMTAPKIASAAPRPIGGKAGTFRVYATWADAAGGAPADLVAVVDGACTPMTKELGDPTRNATYYADVPLGDGCHAVYVVGHDAAGARWSYPTTTAFTIAVGAGACAAEVAQPASSCGGTPAVDGGGAVDDGGSPGGGDGGVAGGADGGATGGATGGGTGGGGDSGGAAEPPGGGGHGGGLTIGGCSVAPRGEAGGAVLALALGALALLVRRRARRR